MAKVQPQNGSVFRVHKTHDYTVMSNHHLKNRELPLKAKGLLSIMLSLPPEWNFSINGLAALSSDGRDSIIATMKILQDSQYIHLEKVRNERGQFDTFYHIFEEPQEGVILTESDFPSRSDRVGAAESEKPTQLNIKELNTNELSIQDSINPRLAPWGITKEEKKIKRSFGQFKNVTLTSEHIENLLVTYKGEEKLKKAIEILSSYKAANGKKYKNDYAVLVESNWVYKKVFSKNSNSSNFSAAEIKKTESDIPDYEKNSKW